MSCQPVTDIGKPRGQPELHRRESCMASWDFGRLPQPYNRASTVRPEPCKFARCSHALACDRARHRMRAGCIRLCEPAATCRLPRARRQHEPRSLYYLVHRENRTMSSNGLLSWCKHISQSSRLRFVRIQPRSSTFTQPPN
jgi:hypothetical protein